MIENVQAIRFRQVVLFPTGSVLGQRFGQEFFLNLPKAPGVYFFSDAQARLLYIGQSSCLRSRIGSYRHVVQGRHPKRTLRLVARIHHIEWEHCGTAAEAIERERELLLERRPPFNRAGVWKGPPWWLSGKPGPQGLSLRLGREPIGIGPFPPSFRYVFGSLARCVYRATLPELAFHRYPCGLMKSSVPLSLSLPLPSAEAAWELFKMSASGAMQPLLDILDALPLPPSAQEQEFWLADREMLENHANKGVADLIVETDSTEELDPWQLIAG